MRTPHQRRQAVERMQREGGINAQQTTLHTFPHTSRHSCRINSCVVGVMALLYAEIIALDKCDLEKPLESPAVPLDECA